MKINPQIFSKKKYRKKLNLIVNEELVQIVTIEEIKN